MQVSLAKDGISEKTRNEVILLYLLRIIALLLLSNYLVSHRANQTEGQRGHLGLSRKVVQLH